MTGAGDGGRIRSILWGVAIADLLFLAFGLTSQQVSFWANNNNWQNQFWRSIGGTGLAWALAAIGIVTFFGTLAISSRSIKAAESESRLRLSITAAFMAVYFSALGPLLLFVHRSNSKYSYPFASTLLTNFTALMVVVVGSFFGASAYAQRQRSQNSSESASSGEPSEGPPSPG
jgi:hypothetical protein